MTDSLFPLVLAASTLVDAVPAGLAVFAPFGGNGRSTVGRTISAGRLMAAAVASGAVFLLKLPLWSVLGLNFFGVIHLAYLDLVVAMPLIGAAVLAARIGSMRRSRWPRPSRAACAMAGLACLGAPLGVYATFIEPFRLQIEAARIALPPERAGEGCVRIGVLADIQTDRVTNYECRVVSDLMAQAPDVILIPGDVFQGGDEAFEREVPALRAMLGKLSAPGGVYLSLGNMDPPQRMSRIIEGTAVHLLVDDVATVMVRGRRLTVGAVGSPPGGESLRLIQALETRADAEDIRILMAHDPGAVLGLSPKSRIDLVVSGHTHGGQIQLPWIGPVMTLSAAPRSVCAGGYHELDGRRIYVSRGIGCERGQAPRIRFLCPPEIAILTTG